MLKKWIVVWVQRLLAWKVSHREISRITRVSRGRISLIAKGLRPDYEALRRFREEARVAIDPARPAKRCPGCGYKVQLPCIICRARAAVAAHSRRQTTDSSDGFRTPLRLDLKPKHNLRYARIRKRRDRHSRGRIEPELDDY